MEKTPSTKHDLDINSISELRGIDSYDLASNTGIWHIPDMPDHIIEKTGTDSARFVTISGRDPETHDHEQLQRYLRRLGETAIIGNNLAAHSSSEYAY
jgi:hypothetical protein